jgi:hypothetical protein
MVIEGTVVRWMRKEAATEAASHLGQRKREVCNQSRRTQCQDD